MRVTRAFVCVLGVVLTTVSYAEQLRYTIDKNGNPALRQEAKAPLPAFPEEDNLMRIDAPVRGGGNQFFIDRASIARDLDLVMRYTVVVRSPSGVQNTMHEGMACGLRQVKTYAYGNGKRQFVEFYRPRWRAISYHGVKGYQGILADRFLCDDSHGYLDRDSVLDRLDNPGSVDGDDGGVDGHDND
jgi:hypothetical protein